MFTIQKEAPNQENQFGRKKKITITLSDINVYIKIHKSWKKTESE